MVEKAVIPVAGLGTRMLPACKSIPKEILPVVDRPAIAYVVDEAVRSGIKQIILVTNRASGVIADYFDRSMALEEVLQRKGKDELLASVREVIPDDVQVVSVRQRAPLGLGHAIYSARSVVGDSPFAVLLSDVLVDCGDRREDLARMIDLYRQSGKAQVMVEPVAGDQVDRYGIVDTAGASPVAGDAVDLRGLVEKPSREAAPSNLSVVGRYVLPASIMSVLAGSAPGANDEIQLTDAIEGLVGSQGVQAYGMSGRAFDCGSKPGYLQAFFHYALRHPETADMARAIARSAVEAGDAD